MRLINRLGERLGLLPPENMPHNTAMERKNVLSESTDFYVREAYNALRSNVIFSLPGQGCKRLCVVSGLASEGKSITALNLSISLAETGAKVLLIDADMRRPNQDRLLSCSAVPGLSNVLVGLSSLDEAILHLETSGLHLLPAGDIPPNPSELLNSAQMGAIMETLAPCYDYIIFDVPPINVVTDASVLIKYTDGVLLVVLQDRADQDAVSAAITTLEFAGGKILGFVLNGTKQAGKRYSGYGYGYGGYGYGYGEQGGKAARAREKK